MLQRNHISNIINCATLDIFQLLGIEICDILSTDNVLWISSVGHMLNCHFSAILRLDIHLLSSLSSLSLATEVYPE